MTVELGLSQSPLQNRLPQGEFMPEILAPAAHKQELLLASFDCPPPYRTMPESVALQTSKNLVVKYSAFSYLLPQPHLSGAGANWICPKVHVQKQYNRKQLTSEEPDEV